MNATRVDVDRLAAQAAHGDLTALEALCREIWPEVRKLSLVLLGDPAAAEDAAQDSLIGLARDIGRYDPTRPFGPWWRTAVRNRCRSARRGPQPILADLSGDAPSEAADPDRTLDLDRASRSALAAFASLTPRQREVIDLCDRRGLEPSDAAQELDIAQGTARALLHQARRALRERLLRQHPELLDLLRTR